MHYFHIMETKSRINRTKTSIGRKNMIADFTGLHKQNKQTKSEPYPQLTDVWFKILLILTIELRVLFSKYFRSGHSKHCVLDINS